LVKIREEVGEQIIEYGRDYIKRREMVRIEEVLKRKETSSISSSNSSSPIPLPSFSFPSTPLLLLSSSSFLFSSQN
jgi:hypothetical protein